jgi:hypothetical protein
MIDWREDIDDWDSGDFEELSENHDLDFDDAEDSEDNIEIEDIDFSNIQGRNLQERFKKITRKASVARIVPKKKEKIVAKRNVHYKFSKQKGKKNITQVKLPNNKEILIKGVDEFILSQDDASTAIKNIGYYKGKKLKELMLIINNTTPNDIEFELFNPSMPLDYMYATSGNLNDEIKVAGDNKVSYSDLLFNILANPTMIPNAKFVASGAQQAQQINQPLTFINKNIEGKEMIHPLQNSLNIDIDQQQNEILYWDIEKTLGRVFVPDGMDILKYKVLSGMTVIFGFYFKQIQLKKVFYPETRNRGIL